MAQRRRDGAEKDDGSCYDSEKSVAELLGRVRGSNSKPQAQPPGSLAASTPVLKVTDLGEFAHTRPGSLNGAGCFLSGH